MDNNLYEDILQEECAEVIQAISKIKRFGFSNQYRVQGNNKNDLEVELGQLLAMVHIVMDKFELDDTTITNAYNAKFATLNKWTTISDECRCYPK
jgi:NTP pyrophosphatase (non-canonical NTP hydrolase)